MTARRRDGNDSPTCAWIRGHPRLHSIRERLCVTDCDLWIHQYRAHTDKVGDRLIDSIMLVELKTHSAGLPSPQRDTLRLVNEGFRRAFMPSGSITTQTMVFGSEVRKVRIYGVFLLRLSDESPDKSAIIEWHGRRIDLDTLVDILCFERDPRTLRERAERRHHLPGAKQRHPDLFVAASRA